MSALTSAPTTELPVRPLPAGTLLIGDLHLDVELEPEASGICAFEAWLEAARGAPALVILGDLFEYWIGAAQERSAGASRVFDALAGLAADGTSIELLCGNRDFLLSERSAEQAGARLHPEGLVGELPGGGRALILHGDTLCTLDVGYLRLRRLLRSPPVQVLGPRLPAPVGSALARRLRRASSRATAAKPREELALQPEAAARAMRSSNCQYVLCGHAHRFRDEELPGGGRLLVVDAFGGERDTLRVGVDGVPAPGPLRP